MGSTFWGVDPTFPGDWSLHPGEWILLPGKAKPPPSAFKYPEITNMQSNEIYTVRLKTEMMSPTIKINETVNAVRVNEIKHDGLYISINEINGEEVMWIKRLFFQEDKNSFFAKCDNPNHSEMIISSEILKRNQLNLRVFNVMQTIDRI